MVSIRNLKRWMKSGKVHWSESWGKLTCPQVFGLRKCYARLRHRDEVQSESGRVATRSGSDLWLVCEARKHEDVEEEPHVAHSLRAEKSRRVTLMERRTAAWTCGVFVLLLGFCLCNKQKQRPVCWKAIAQCHSEPECLYAYEQYTHACAPVLSGERRTCPSHCVSALIQLNLTRGGPALEDCDCALDPLCASTKRAIEPCVPRTRARTGCTDARRRCEVEPACGAATRDYLFHCRRLFGGGRRCSAQCRAVIARMRDIPAARRLDTCVCDGQERIICEHVKVSMKTFCKDGEEEKSDGSGFSDAEEDDDDDAGFHASAACARLQSALITLLLLTGGVFI